MKRVVQRDSRERGKDKKQAVNDFLKSWEIYYEKFETNGKKNKNGIVLSTDNYYKTGLISKLLPKFVEGFFDRSISFNNKLFKKDFDFIYKNGISICDRYYNFEKKTIQNISNETNNISFLIVEGIFAKEFSNTLNNKDYIFLEIKTKKSECMKRVVQRDIKERGKDKKQAENDFLKSWNIYYEKFKPNSIKNNTNKFIIEKNTDIDHILKKLFN